jgi:anti-sigma factor RsiW
MTDMDPSELSALLDGELSATRAAQVKAIIAADPRVLAEYERLEQADARWRSMACGAAFKAPVRLPPVRAELSPLAIAGLCFIPMASLAGKVEGAMIPSLALNGLALLVVVGWVVAAASSNPRPANFPLS